MPALRGIGGAIVSEIYITRVVMGCQEKKAEVGWVPVSHEFVRAQALAPTRSEPPFLGTQVVVMLIFIVSGVLAAKRSPAEAVRAA